MIQNHDYVESGATEKKCGNLFASITGFALSMIPKGRKKYHKYISNHECIIYDIVLKPGKDIDLRSFPRAGPRRELHFNPKTVNAAIVTCGGLCPGLNSVVRSLTHSLLFEYGASTVWGIRGGYTGFYSKECQPIKLTPEVVENIHHAGGTVLSSSRGGFDMDKVQGFIRNKKIKQLYSEFHPKKAIQISFFIVEFFFTNICNPNSNRRGRHP